MIGTPASTMAESLFANRAFSLTLIFPSNRLPHSIPCADLLVSKGLLLSLRTSVVGRMPRLRRPRRASAGLEASTVISLMRPLRVA